MNFKRYHVSRQLFDYSTITTGYRIQWTTGNDYADTTAIMSDFIPVELGWYALSTSANIVGYASDKSYVGVYRADIKTWEKRMAGDTTNFEIINGSNIAYVKIMTYGEMPSISSVTMLNKGTAILPYEPYSSEVWFDSHYIRGTATDTLTLPQTIYADGTNATLTLKGNMQQTGTPSPSTPVMPNGVGERTENLFNSNDFGLVQVTATAYRKGTNLGILPQGTYTLSATTNNPIPIYRTIKTGDAYTFETISSLPYNFTADGVSEQIIRTSDTGGNSWADVGYTNIMLNLGSTAKPYEPYGYKIPISNNSQTYNKYLGEEQTVRQIKKLVLTGDESWILETGTTYQCTVDMPLVGYTDELSTHYQMANSYTELISTNNTFALSKRPALFINDSRFLTVAGLKSYLAQQYANGTPVTIWYVLATATTGIVNEPLCKIGDYADTLSTSIPTTDGANVIDVDTTLKPSEVSANYHGWHPVANAHEKSRNLFDESTIQNGYYGSFESYSRFTSDDKYRAFQMSIKAGTYTIKIQADEGIRLLRIATENEFYNVQEDNRAYTFEISSDAIVYVSWRNLQTTNSFTNMTVMLNSGQTSLPYEPYWK